MPWYRQFWPWFLIVPPAVAVLAGIATLVIALKNPHHLVVEDYYRQGLLYNHKLAADENTPSAAAPVEAKVGEHEQQ